MVNPYRIKEYIFPQIVADNVGSQLTQYSANIINGEVLRIDNFSNYTGSLILKQSGLNVAWTNLTTTSGTNKYESLSFTNNTGSFVINGIFQLIISGVSSGTGVNVGPVSILYR